MKKIQILGTGCPKCKQLTANVEEAVKQLGIEADIEKVTDINQITSLGVMVTPALIVDGKIVNHPSDKEGERKVGDAILVTPRGDR